MRWHRVRVLLAVCCALVVLPGLSFATRWDVYADGTGDAPTIQAAINLAASGDSVVLAPGTFRGPGNRDVSFQGKALVVMSSAGSESTVVDCEGAGRGFIFNSGEPRSAQLQEITILNGSADQGGGIYIANSSHPLVRRCVVTRCNALRGGGIYCGDFSDATIDHNLIVGNTASNGGGFSDDQYCFVQVQFNTIRDNTALNVGGGIFTANDTGDPIFEGNTIEGNSAAKGGGIGATGQFFTIVGNRILGNSGSFGAGIYVASGRRSLDGNLIAGNNGVGVYLESSAPLQNCTIVSNSSHGVFVDSGRPPVSKCIIAFNGGNAVACTGGSRPTLDCCDVFGNGEGPPCAESLNNHITSDPLFCTVPGENEFNLRAGSPCAPSVSPCGELIGALPVSDCPTPAFVLCPPDTTVPLGPGGTLMTVGAFKITNGAAVSIAFSYQVTSTGPATLWDRGNPLALMGETPPLLPGETYTLPQAGLFIAGNPGMFVQELQCDVDDGTGTDKTCATSVAFVQALPVAFNSFKARLEGRAVHLAWAMSHEGADEIVVRRRTVDDVRAATVIARLPIDVLDYTDVTAEPGRVSEYDLSMVAGGEEVAVSSPVRVHVPALALALPVRLTEPVSHFNAHRLRRARARDGHAGGIRCPWTANSHAMERFVASRQPPGRLGA